MNQNTLKAYFGFLTEPFSKEIATKALFISEQLKALFERLQHFMVRRGIALVTGEVGAGKSTALRAFTETLDKNHQAIVYIDDPTLGLRGMFNSIARQLNLNTKFFTWSRPAGCPSSKPPLRKTLRTITRRRWSSSMMRSISNHWPSKPCDC
jgi:type II secretory pathway predicted ATPase ExeA